MALLRLITLVVVIASVAVFPRDLAATVAVETPDARQLLKAVNDATAAIRSYDLSINITTHYYFKVASTADKKPAHNVPPTRLEKPEVARDHYRQWKKGQLCRFDTLNGPRAAATISVLADSVAFQTLDRASARFIIQRPIGPAVDMGRDYREYYGHVRGSSSIHDVFSRRKSIALFSPSKERGKGELGLMVKPEVPSDSSYPRSQFELVLDPGHGWLPWVIIEKGEYGGQLRLKREMQVTKWHRLPDGVSVPIEATWRGYYFDGPLTGELSSESYMAVDVNSSTWNQPVSDSVFRLHIPAGVEVTDRLQSVNYVAGQASINGNLAELAENAVKLSPIPETPVKAPPTATRWWIVLGVAAVLGVGALFRFRRRFRW